MNVRLESDDSHLQKMCREIAEEFPSLNLHITSGAHSGFAGNPDYFVWDFRPDTQIAAGACRRLSRHLFLISRKDLPALHGQLGRTDACVLLKPVRMETLSAFLSMAAAAHEEGKASPRQEAAREDKEDLVRYLAGANLKIQDMDQERAQFIARGLHDFRTPLTAILGYCALMRNGSLGPLSEEQRDILERMEHSTRRLSRMTAGLFQLSANGRLGRNANLELADIGECVVQAAHEIRPIANRKQISISIALEPGTPAFHFEPGLVEQVLINLLENACKFTPKGGQIEIKGAAVFWERRAPAHSSGSKSERRNQASLQVNAYRLDVRDSGEPIPAGHLQNLSGADNPDLGGPDRAGGGLGLVICKMAAAQHGGRILAQNTDLGPIFSLILPLRAELRNVPAGAFHKVVNSTEVHS